MKTSIFIGDCLAKMQAMPGGFVDLLVTSPPYNIGKAYEKRQALDTYAEWMESIVVESARLLKEGGSACWQVGNYVKDGVVLPLDYLFMPMLERAGLTLRHRMIWHFHAGLHATKRFSGRHETILWATKGPSRYHVAQARALMGDVIEVTNIKNNHPERTGHPAQFPEGLIRPLILALSREGDIVLDPFFGSGTTGSVAAQLSRNCIGIERDERYVEMAAARIRGAADMLSPRDIVVA